MSNSYKYLDLDYTYIDPKTGILRNIQSITDPEVLLFVESGAVTKRLRELHAKPIKIKGIESLFEIHKHIFQAQNVSSNMTTFSASSALSLVFVRQFFKPISR